MSLSNTVIENAFSSISQVHTLFGYVEDWVNIPLEDSREYYWQLVDLHFDEDNRIVSGSVRYAYTKEDLLNIESGEYYEDEIYTQRFLPKWVYRIDTHTMVSSNPGVDGNRFLRIFDNTKEIPNE